MWVVMFKVDAGPSVGRWIVNFETDDLEAARSFVARRKHLVECRIAAIVE